jgi:acetyl-CoA carboxylase biotin carboxyl carrier protein
MTESASPNHEPFNIDRLKELVEIMEQHGLTEVSLERGDEKWRLCRGAIGGGPVISQPTYAAPAQAAPAAAQPPEARQPDNSLYIKSPTVGTFYSAPSPDEPPFANVGTRVHPDTIVCIVEAMKVFNQIPAEVSGTIVEVLIHNGDSVEFGQQLFRVRPD